MNIFDQVSEGIKKAMLARNHAELDALRNIKKELLEAKTSKEANGEVTDELAIKIIQKMKKQGEDAIDMFRQQNRQDLIDEYQGQIDVYKRFLPEMMSEIEIERVVRETAEKIGAKAMTDMGKLMGNVTKQLAGRAEGRIISTIVKKVLSE
ncbi:MAG: GatB/YqeY domain-containing protein [Paludibacteraceae bacterium]|nr:GatB/YqeY domain-containing protein [Paludibacteraceae bacterium]